MRRGGRRTRRGRVAAAAVTATAVAGTVAGVPLLRDRSQQRLERRAEREVTATAQRTRAELLATPTAPRERLRSTAAQVAGVEVLEVRDQPVRAVRLVFRVRVAKTATSLFGWQRANADGCFALVVQARPVPAAIERLPCPA
ncbi:hypothetical protein [Micromonospora siamensis]|uniref:hypothetical protein n=1 Tax=Micromonospora siamensis TaxID=299152 RepID=UPI0012FD1096|nr:hypothetical protein [Micromonospora siamensis]